MQRDVEFEVETVDKSGGFIGALYLNKNENAAIALVQEGLASVHAFSAENLPWAQQLFTAEAEAKKAKKNVGFFRLSDSGEFVDWIHQLWLDYDENAEKEEEVASAETEGPLKTEYLDVVISDVRTHNGVTFSIQILNTEGD